MARDRPARVVRSVRLQLGAVISPDGEQLLCRPLTTLSQYLAVYKPAYVRFPLAKTKNISIVG